MYPNVPCAICGGGIAFLPQIAGRAVMCPHCGSMVTMPGGSEPEYEPEPQYVPQRAHAPRKRRQAPMWPGIVLGGGLATVLYFVIAADPKLLTIQLIDENESIVAAVLRTIASGTSQGLALGGIFVGSFLILFGIVCFLLGSRGK